MAPTHQSSNRCTGANTSQHSVPEKSRTPCCWWKKVTCLIFCCCYWNGRGSIRTVARRIRRIRNTLRDSLASALYFVNLQQQRRDSYIYSTSGPVPLTLTKFATRVWKIDQTGWNCRRIDHFREQRYPSSI